MQHESKSFQADISLSLTNSPLSKKRCETYDVCQRKGLLEIGLGPVDLSLWCQSEM